MIEPDNILSERERIGRNVLLLLFKGKTFLLSSKAIEFASSFIIWARGGVENSKEDVFHFVINFESDSGGGWERVREKEIEIKWQCTFNYIKSKRKESFFFSILLVTIKSCAKKKITEVYPMYGI